MWKLDNCFHGFKVDEISTHNVGCSLGAKGAIILFCDCSNLRKLCDGVFTFSKEEGVDNVIPSPSEPIIQRIAVNTMKQERVLDPINCFRRTSDHSLGNFNVQTFRQIVATQNMALYNFEAIKDQEVTRTSYKIDRTV